MKIYTKIVLDKNNNLIEENYYNYNGPLAFCGIHYTYGANKGNKLMEKQAKKEKRLAEKKRKRLEKDGPKVEETKEKEKTMNTSTPLSLEAITNPDKE
mgnify:CR=1 FL=1|tara:strand:+ start:1474 stop:1767 length:294 start_codon:yes stop_codon:yes gene_type:complete